MAVKIDTTARIEKIRVQPQGAFPTGDPESGYGWLYFVTGSANGGMYFENDAGMRIGPFITGSVASQSSGIPANGWISDANTWSYLSSTVVSVNANITGSVGVGNRIQLTQTTPKYFIATNISLTGSTTYLNLYGGTDYTLANAAITNTYYSPIKAPFGFPLDPTKWQVLVTDGTQRTQSSPTQNTWYNLGTTACQITVPVGAWQLSYKVYAVPYKASSTDVDQQVTLSTANNSESNANFTGILRKTGASALSFIAGQTIYISNYVVVASSTTYYLNARTTIASTNNITFDNGVTQMVLTAHCAYL